MLGKLYLTIALFKIILAIVYPISLFFPTQTLAIAIILWLNHNKLDILTNNPTKINKSNMIFILILLLLSIFFFFNNKNELEMPYTNFVFFASSYLDESILYLFFKKYISKQAEYYVIGVEWLLLLIMQLTGMLVFDPNIYLYNIGLLLLIFIHVTQLKHVYNHTSLLEFMMINLSIALLSESLNLIISFNYSFYIYLVLIMTIYQLCFIDLKKWRTL